MAAIVIPKEGSEFGPCVGECSHTDCFITRADAKRLCRQCRNIDIPVHASCYAQYSYWEPGEMAPPAPPRPSR